MVDFGGAIKKPFTNVTTLIIGIIISIIPIINFATYGYGLKVAELSMNKNNSLPGWNEAIMYWVKGLLSIIMMIIYFIPAAIFLIAAIASILPTLFVFGPINQTAFLDALLVAGPLALIGVILAIIALYVGPIALMFYAKENKFGAAFKFGAIFKKALTAKWFVTWIVSIIYSIIVMAIVFIILGWIPVAGMLVASGIGTWLVTVSTYTMYAQAVSEIQ